MRKGINVNQLSADIRVDTNKSAKLKLTDFIPAGKYYGGVIKGVIEHDPFDTMVIFRLGKLKLNKKAEVYLRKVYNNKKNGRNF